MRRSSINRLKLFLNINLIPSSRKNTTYLIIKVDVFGQKRTAYIMKSDSVVWVLISGSDYSLRDSLPVSAFLFEFRHHAHYEPTTCDCL